MGTVHLFDRRCVLVGTIPMPLAPQTSPIATLVGSLGSANRSRRSDELDRVASGYHDPGLSSREGPLDNALRNSADGKIPLLWLLSITSCLKGSVVELDTPTSRRCC
jgi:hypothetical protein